MRSLGLGRLKDLSLWTLKNRLQTHGRSVIYNGELFERRSLFWLHHKTQRGPFCRCKKLCKVCAWRSYSPTCLWLLTEFLAICERKWKASSRLRVLSKRMTIPQDRPSQPGLNTIRAFRRNGGRPYLHRVRPGPIKLGWRNPMKVPLTQLKVVERCKPLLSFMIAVFQLQTAPGCWRLW